MAFLAQLLTLIAGLAVLCQADSRTTPWHTVSLGAVGWQLAVPAEWRRNTDAPCGLDNERGLAACAEFLPPKDPNAEFTGALRLSIGRYVKARYRRMRYEETPEEQTVLVVKNEVTVAAKPATRFDFRVPATEGSVSIQRRIEIVSGQNVWIFAFGYGLERDPGDCDPPRQTSDRELCREIRSADDVMRRIMSSAVMRLDAKNLGSNSQANKQSPK